MVLDGQTLLRDRQDHHRLSDEQEDSDLVALLPQSPIESCLCSQSVEERLDLTALLVVVVVVVVVVVFWHCH
jgi:hypothetical protein